MVLPLKVIISKTVENKKFVSLSFFCIIAVKMKKLYILSLIASLGFAIFVLDSCKPNEDDGNVTPAGPKCYISTIFDGIDSIIYTYNDANQLIRENNDGVITNFSYSNGQLTKITSSNVNTDIVYTNGNITRLNYSKAGVSKGYTILEGSNNKFTKVERHREDGKIELVTFITYGADGNITLLEDKNFDPIDKTYSIVGTAKSFVYDNKKNPFSENIALRVKDLSPLVGFSENNVKSFTYKTRTGTENPYAFDYEYNSKNYPDFVSNNLYEDSEITYICK